MAQKKDAAKKSEPVSFADRGWWFCIEMDAGADGNPPYQTSLIPSGKTLVLNGSHVFQHILKADQMHLVKALAFALEPGMRFYLCGHQISFDEAKKVVTDDSRWGKTPAKA